MNILFLLAAILMGFSGMAGAATTADDVLRRMDEAQKNAGALQFVYAQTVAYGLTGEHQDMRGTVLMAPPDKLSVRQTAPVEQLIVSDGKKVWVYTPSYRQVLVSSFKDWSKSSIVPSSLLNIGSLGKDISAQYTVVLSSEDATGYTVALTPKAKGPWNMTLRVDRVTMMPVQVMITGDNVQITMVLNDYHLNVPADKKMFTFTAPPGVEEIKVP